MRTLPALLLSAVVLRAANPAFTDFNTNQFDTTGNKVALKGGTATNPVIVTNITVIQTNTVNYLQVTNVTVIQTNTFNVSKGGHLVISNSLSVLTVKTNLLATDSTGLVTNAVYGTGISWDPSTRTLSASGGGDSSGTNVVTLTQSGTNVSAMDFSLIQNGGVFKLALTNNAFMPTPSGVNSGYFRKAWLQVQQPSTGTCFVTWTNGTFCGPEGLSLVNDTNNGAVVIYELTTDVWTNGLVHVWMSQKSKLMP